MAEIHNLDVTQIPLSALKNSTLITLSTSLNPLKVIPTTNGLPRDWRGLAQLMGLNSTETNHISTMPDQLSALISHWGIKGNISLFQEYLSCIDRYDVLDDTKEALLKDSLDYMERLKNINTIPYNINIEADKNILTIDDVIRLKNGLKPQIYDAYILYAEEDCEFATEIVETMEKKYNFKLCVRDRDLIGGVQFEHDAITKLIAERCRRLVVIVSSNFFKSKANKFFVTFAQALGIDTRERKVIPILYEHCEVPPELSYYFLLDYNRAGKLWNFWDKLRDSIQAPEVSQSNAMARGKAPSETSGSKNSIWISRTHFEEEVKSPDEKLDEISMADTRPSAKKTNIYKIIKNSFSRVKKSVNSQDGNGKNSEIGYDTCLLDKITNIVSGGDGVPFENFNNSSSFQTKEENNERKEESKKVKKKKWYKKKAVESLLS